MATGLKRTPEARLLALAVLLAGAACTDLRLLDHDQPHFLQTPRWSSDRHTARLQRVESRLRFSSTIPASAVACRQHLGADEACDDRDLDGLADQWERALLDRLQPTLRLHSDEPLLGDVNASAVALGRVVPAAEPPGRLRVFIALLYGRDYGRCSFTGHRGDVERVALDLAPAGADFVVVGAYTAAHEYTAFDGSRLYREDELSALELEADVASGNLRWRIYASSGKHASYVSPATCRAHASALCTREDCPPAAGGRDLLTGIRWAGEPRCPAAPWGPAPFCGLRLFDGMDSTGCAPPIREKLMRDPFAGHRELPPPPAPEGATAQCPTDNIDNLVH
jgi:hypothetical protein